MEKWICGLSIGQKDGILVLGYFGSFEVFITSQIFCTTYVLGPCEAL